MRGDMVQWFDIVMLANADATEPLVKDGRALVWWSHDITITASGSG